ncbi:DUF4430 domain-containing protein [Methanococcoides sp. LMO-2]|uniref:DUF4430 domain-containing protein n=1 Tax=Methanococcoides cohabitans TaxID=3136559 RepID=A0ABU9KZ54_9EURY
MGKYGMIKRFWIIGMIALLSAVFLMPSMAGAEATVIWDEEIELPSGYVNFTPTDNQSANYSTYNFTDLGALLFVNETEGINYDITGSPGTYWINALNGTSNEIWGTENSSTWYIYINDVAASKGIGGNSVSNGDKITFWYAPTNTTTFEHDITKATYVMNITLKSAVVEWAGEIELPSGYVNFTPTDNQSANYSTYNFTDLGALLFINETEGISYNISDRWYSSSGFWIDGINGIDNEPWDAGKSKGWGIFINGVKAPNGIGQNSVSNGDKITFWYCPNDANTFEPLLGEATRVLNITLKAPIVEWDGEIELPSGYTNFTPTDNQSANYSTYNFTDLGALLFVNETEGISYNISDRWYSSSGFWIDGINGIDNEPWDAGKSKGWAIFINGVKAPNGIGQNSVSNGDKITFWYCPNDANTFEPLLGEATRVLNITVAIETISNSKSSSGGIGHATIVTLADKEEPATPEETPVVDDTPAVEEETKAEPQPAEPVTESNVETEDQNSTPGFEAAFAVSGLLLSAVFIMRRRM